MAYSDKVLDHYQHPRNVGSLWTRTTRRRRHRHRRGARVRRRHEAPDQASTTAASIVDAKFKTYGCGSAIASSSLATEWLKGTTGGHGDAQIRNTQIVEELSLPPVKIHCSVLAEDAIKAAIEDWRNKRAASQATGAREGTEVRS
jgi:nitrogen fixation NifU-like protein